MRKSSVVLCLSAAFVLTACGGGDDSPPPATNGVPADATASVGAFTAFVKRLVAEPSETLEPFDISAVEPPVSESTEPDAVD